MLIYYLVFGMLVLYLSVQIFSHVVSRKEYNKLKREIEDPLEEIIARNYLIHQPDHIKYFKAYSVLYSLSSDQLQMTLLFLKLKKEIYSSSVKENLYERLIIPITLFVALVSIFINAFPGLEAKFETFQIIISAIVALTLLFSIADSLNRKNESHNKKTLKLITLHLTVAEQVKLSTGINGI